MILNTTVDYPDGIVTCFEPVTSFVNQSGGLGEMYEGGINQDIRAFSAAIAQQLQVLAGIASGFGLFDNDVSETLQDTAQVFWQIAYGNVLENEIVMTIASNARRLEIILNRIEPIAPNSQLIAELRSIIQLIKEAVGLEYNVAWVTLAGQLPQGVNIYPGDELSSGPQMEAIQEALVLLGLMDPLSVTGELDLVTQQALATFQEINGISFLELGSGVTGQDGIAGQGGVAGSGGIGNQDSIAIDQVFVSAEALELLQQMISSSSGIYNQSEAASIEDYFTEVMGLGAFSQDVMELQVLLYGLGYDISSFDGIFDEEVCLALQQYQLDNNLSVADTNDCEVSAETLQSFNDMLRNEDFLGSGFVVNSNGALEGNGSFEGMFGPGAINFEVSEAEANSLREGDIVLMYTFLDEETILITRNEVIINEVIQRRALEDIFGQ
jgi:peptidoglycan hydrolase-like protein with peptidoglycan-binding domain